MLLINNVTEDPVIRKHVIFFLSYILVFVLKVGAQVIDIPNASFETGRDRPDSWTLSGGKGEWPVPGTGVGKAIAVKGNGDDDNVWMSKPVEMIPGTIYRISFSARSIEGSGGTPISGSTFCNRDLGSIPEQWTRYADIFVTPDILFPADTGLRFGQWHVKGTVLFDDVSLMKAEPVYMRDGAIELGEGEVVSGNTYSFKAPFARTSLNHSRPLAGHRCRFNSNRWCLSKDSEIIYRHIISGRRQLSGGVSVAIGWHTGGSLKVEAGLDGKTWRELGVMKGVDSQSFDLPRAMVSADSPAECVWIRLRADGNANLQVCQYDYEAILEGAPMRMEGLTRYISIIATDPRLDVVFESLGEGVPGGRNKLSCRINNKTVDKLKIAPRIMLLRGEEEEMFSGKSMKLEPGWNNCSVDYDLSGIGLTDMTITLGTDSNYRAGTSFRVAELYDTSYGEKLSSDDDVELWWASSGWKVARSRPAPGKKGSSVRISAARNEAEAAQLVIRPGKAVRGLTAAASDLKGPGRSIISSGQVEILRVRYVNVTTPTDSVGVAGDWPDPLPPFIAPINLEPGRNQPLWIRVKVPRNTPAGAYKGEITLRADNFEKTVPLEVTVYGFELPDRMSCVTAFGFSPWNVWRYHGITDDAQKRIVLDKYFKNLSEHHIAPYDPAPMDGFNVSWPNRGPWQGGQMVRDEKQSGAGSLKVADTSTNAMASASYNLPVQVPASGLKLKFNYKTHAPGHRFIVSLNHQDKDGKWMSGRNHDMTITGNGQWQVFEKSITEFPEGAKSVLLTLFGTMWRDDGLYTGTVWYDDLSLSECESGKEIVKGGDFESPDAGMLKPVFDFDNWDKAMTRAVDQYHFNSFMVRMQGMGGGTFHERTDPSLLGYTEDTPEYEAAFSSYCSQLQEHLREKGWLDEAFVYWFDEPDPKDYEFVMNGFRKLKKYAPDISRMLTEQVEDDLVGGPNLWCPVSSCYNHERAEERQQAGDRFWWYVCTGPKAPYCTLFIDHPATELRAWLWQTWQRNIIGILVWETTYWTSSTAYPDRDYPQNPYEDPMGWTSGYGTPIGAKQPWGNGDGRFIYPPESAADAHPAQPVLDGPVDSIRWEMLRDGIEDYEYFVMLKNLIEQKKASSSKDELAAYMELLEVPESVTKSMTEFTKDPAPIEAHRAAMAAAIEKLAKKR